MPKDAKGHGNGNGNGNREVDARFLKYLQDARADEIAIRTRSDEADRLLCLLREPNALVVVEELDEFLTH